MMIRTADSKGRVTLPGFAGATVIVERVNETEYRVRKVQVLPESEMRFPEENFPVQLSAADTRKVLAALENPPAPNAAARNAARRFTAAD